MLVGCPCECSNIGIASATNGIGTSSYPEFMIVLLLEELPLSLL